MQTEPLSILMSSGFVHISIIASVTMEMTAMKPIARLYFHPVGFRSYFFIKNNRIMTPAGMESVITDIPASTCPVAHRIQFNVKLTIPVVTSMIQLALPADFRSTFSFSFSDMMPVGERSSGCFQQSSPARIKMPPVSKPM